jgi:hypothetical protein
VSVRTKGDVVRDLQGRWRDGKPDAYNAFALAVTAAALPPLIA